MPLPQAARSGRPHAFAGSGGASAHAPWMHAGASDVSHVLTPGHAGLGGQSRLAFQLATWPVGTAVSLPPSTQPQQSAGTSVQSLLAVQLREIRAMQLQVAQPFESIT